MPVGWWLIAELSDRSEPWRGRGTCKPQSRPFDRKRGLQDAKISLNPNPPTGELS